MRCPLKSLFIALLASVAAVGCTSATHRIATESRESSGVFTREGPRISVQFEGREYVAQNFPVFRTVDRTRLRTRYGSGSHYTSIISGLDRDHDVSSAAPTLTAGEHHMVCSLTWRGTKPPHGSCITDDQRQVDIVFQ